MGYSVTGYYVEQLMQMEFNRHQFEAGFRYFPVSFLLEKDVPGLAAGYSFVTYYPGLVFKQKQAFAGSGIYATFFAETKSSLKLMSAQTLFAARMGLCLNSRWTIFAHGALGFTFNKHTNYNLNSESFTTVVTREFALGIKYYWRIPAAAN